MYRQGDVLLIDELELPADVEKVDDKVLVLAEGEKTGHAHRVRLGKYTKGYRDSDQVWLRVGKHKGATVTHEEHANIKLPASVYRVRIQREYRGGRVNYVSN